ncbi:MAG: RES family NAD+ phosphorylase [Cyclobacteriaceae bacterium]
MILYRIARREHISDVSGTGAMLFGGRWNMKGTRALYTSGTVSLAVLEVIAHLSSDKIDIGLSITELQFPENQPITKIEEMPDGWNSYPYTSSTVSYGTEFLKSGGLCLQIPSAIVPTEYNYLLNPLHEDFHKIRLVDTRPLILDKRLVK